MRTHLLLALALLALASCDAQRVATRQGHSAQSPDTHANPAPVYMPMPVSTSHGEALAGAAGHKATSPPAPAVEEKKGFSGMYFGILVSFVILWAIYLFLYFFEYGSAGDYQFFLSSYITLFVLISLGLSSYFTPSVLTGLLVSSLFIVIAASGFGVMATISSPDRFEGDKHNMGRTRLE